MDGDKIKSDLYRQCFRNRSEKLSVGIFTANTAKERSTGSFVFLRKIFFHFLAIHDIFFKGVCT